MINKTRSFVAFLIPVLMVGPAFSDDAATQAYVQQYVQGYVQNYVKKNAPSVLNTSFYSKRNGDNLSSGTAHQMRDLLYRHRSDTQFAPNASNVKEGYELRTTGQTAFEGINEILEKVNGNDGTENSEITLDTTAQNAFGAINELKGEIDDLAEDIGDISDTLDIPTKVSELENDSGFMAAPDIEDDKKYMYTKDGWAEVKVKDTFPG